MFAEGETLDKLNVCHTWRALESENVCAILFLFSGRFEPTTKHWYNRLLKTIPNAYHGNVFIVHNNFQGNSEDRFADIQHIRRLSENQYAKVSHISNSYKVEDQRAEIQNLLNEWMSQSVFTLKGLTPPEIVYDRDDYEPEEQRFHARVTVIEPRTESYQETRQVETQPWRGRYGHMIGLRKKGVYENVTVTLERVVQKEIPKDQWVIFQKHYRVRHDQTRDYVDDKIIDTYLKD